MSPSQLIANRFQLQDMLGRGARGVGDVYHANDTQTNELPEPVVCLMELQLRESLIVRI